MLSPETKFDSCLLLRNFKVLDKDCFSLEDSANIVSVQSRQSGANSRDNLCHYLPLLLELINRLDLFIFIFFASIL